MPRRPRKISSTNVYHCMIRGINKQDIFFDNNDYLKFKKELFRVKKFFSCKLYSYVLMPNHVHLEVKDDKGYLSEFMKSLQISYSLYFNKKYNRVGHVFQDRFRSKCVENEKYMFDLSRYIHRNPEEAKISKMTRYKWSSYSEYITENPKVLLVDKDEFLSKFSDDKDVALEKFMRFSNKKTKVKNSEELLEYEMKNDLTDNELIYFIKQKLQIENIQEIQNYSANYRNEILKKLGKIEGSTYIQMARILGINVKILQRAINNIGSEVDKNVHSRTVPKKVQNVLEM